MDWKEEESGSGLRLNKGKRQNSLAEIEMLLAVTPGVNVNPDKYCLALSNLGLSLHILRKGAGRV